MKNVIAKTIVPHPIAMDVDYWSGQFLLTLMMLKLYHGWICIPEKPKED